MTMSDNVPKTSIPVLSSEWVHRDRVLYIANTNCKESYSGSWAQKRRCSLLNTIMSILTGLSALHVHGNKSQKHEKDTEK